MIRKNFCFLRQLKIAKIKTTSFATREITRKRRKIVETTFIDIRGRDALRTVTTVQVQSLLDISRGFERLTGVIANVPSREEDASSRILRKPEGSGVAIQNCIFTNF